MDRIPDVTVNFFLVDHGYQADVYICEKLVLELCRDYAGNAPNRDAHIVELLSELARMLDQLRERFHE